MYEEICILAMSNTYNEICIAGVKSSGEWVRPIKSGGRFWNEEDLSFNGLLLQVGQIIGVRGNYLPNPNSEVHTEDFETTSSDLHLINEEDSIFNGDYSQISIAQNQVSDLVRGNLGRSLGIVSLDEINCFKKEYNEKVKYRCNLKLEDLENVLTTDGTYPLNDYNLLPEIQNSPSLPLDISVKFVTIGLATPTRYDGICYPQIVGVIY
jgi:hypothetical protein